MKKIAVWTMMLALILGGTVYGFSLTNAQRSDCPGKIVCPLTGEEVCKDRCPAIDPTRSDCPGKIICPISGEPVCKDKCPLSQSIEKKKAVPSCCQNKNKL